MRLGLTEQQRGCARQARGGGLLPPGSAARFTPIFGFRNRVVHLYDRIDPAIVHRILTQERGDLEELARLLVAALS